MKEAGSETAGKSTCVIATALLDGSISEMDSSMAMEPRESYPELHMERGPK